MSSPVEHVPSDGARAGHSPGEGHGALEVRRGPAVDGPAVDGHGTDGAGVVEVAHHAALVSYNPDAPSEEWGWHGHWGEFAPRGRFLLLALGVVGLLLMAIFGNHVSHVEDYFLVLIALLMAAWMARTELARRRDRRLRP